MSNPFERTYVEFHILQSFPVTCLNRDDVGAPKSAIVGGVTRARVSSQCWKRQVRLALHDLGVRLGIRTKRLDALIAKACQEKGATQEQASACGDVISKAIAKDTLYFIAPAEVALLGEFAKERQFDLGDVLSKPDMTALTKELKKLKTAADALDIALFGRMAAQVPEFNMEAAAAFSHAISTHKASNEVDFFTALDDLKEEQGSAHMGSLEYNTATYYRYISLNIGQLWDNLGGDDLDIAIDAFAKALYIAVPSARQSTQSGACPWEYARILIRRGQRMQASFDKPVKPYSEGHLAPSIEALNNFLLKQEQLGGSLFGKIEEYTFGVDLSFSIDALAKALADFVRAKKP